MAENPYTSDHPLHAAAWDGDLQTVQNLIDNETTPVDAQAEEDGCTALHIAARRKHVAILEFLIDRGADVDLEDDKYNTALVSAAKCGQDRIVEHLIWADADMELEDEGGFTPLARAAQQGNSEIVDILLHHGAVVNPENDDKQTPDEYTTDGGVAECLLSTQILLQHVVLGNADEVRKYVNVGCPFARIRLLGAKICDGNAFHLAIRHRHANVFDVLLQHAERVHRRMHHTFLPPLEIHTLGVRAHLRQNPRRPPHANLPRAMH